jgi:chromosome segregation ATPase
MIAELDRLEERIEEAAGAIQTLREQKERIEARLAEVEQERDRYLQERTKLAERVARLVERVDALRLEI